MTNFWLLYNIFEIVLQVTFACILFNVGWRYAPITLILSAMTITLGMICLSGGTSISIVVVALGAASLIATCFEGSYKIGMLKAR